MAQSLLDQDRSPSDVMRRADLALYDAKSAGRDCVRVWNQTMSKLLNTNDIEIGKVKELQRRVAGLSEKAERMFIQSIWGLVQALEAKNPYAKHLKKQVTIRMGVDIIDYFKKQAEETGIPYQNLINLYLRDCVQTKRKISIKWVS